MRYYVSIAVEFEADSDGQANLRAENILNDLGSALKQEIVGFGCEVVTCFGDDRGEGYVERAED